MELRVRLFASLRERAGKEYLELSDLPDELDVAALKRTLAERFESLGPLDGVRGVIDTRYVEDGTPLEDGQELSLLPPVSGGDGAVLPSAEDEVGRELLRRGVFELRSEPLDPEEARRRVSHPACGATVVFTGSTRERNREKDVAHLDYEAFAAMAESEMAAIFRRCRERFGTDEARALHMLTLHRTGRVGVGEPSVVIAVASPHRDAAFSASRFLIDELKQSVPLWKRESYADGHHWIGDRA